MAVCSSRAQRAEPFSGVRWSRKKPGRTASSWSTSGWPMRLREVTPQKTHTVGSALPEAGSRLRG